MIVLPSPFENCSSAEYAKIILWCIVDKNFLNCPPSMIVKKPRYEKVKKYVENEGKCGSNYGNVFQISPFIWTQHEE